MEVATNLPKGSFIVDYDLAEDLLPSLITQEADTGSIHNTRLSIGDVLDLDVSPTKYCIGYHIRDEYHEYEPCPERSLVTQGVQCAKCGRRDVLFSCMICDGTRCDSLRNPKSKCNVTETSVYLVSFGASLKVGVSTRERLLKRWVEQGADTAIEVGYAPNGMMARLAESKISHDLNVSKTTRIGIKIGAISSQANQGKKLISIAEGALRLARSEYSAFEKGKMTPVSLAPYYETRIETVPFRLEPSKGVQIKGSFSGMKGPLFFFRNGLDYFLDFRILRGHAYSVPRTTGQLTLLDFR